MEILSMSNHEKADKRLIFHEAAAIVTKDTGVFLLLIYALGQLEYVPLPWYMKIRKQPSGGVLKKRCSEKMQQIYRRTLILKCYFNRRKLLIVCNHPFRFGRHRYCGSGYKMFLIYQVISRDHVFKGLCDLMDLSFL